jgi:hypothetical protein
MHALLVGISGRECRAVSFTLDELRDRRAHECRLRPERALGSLAEAEAFLRDRGMLTRTADCALPSLFGACHEEPYREGKGGFGEWPATKYPWFAELAARDGIHELKVHHGKSILMTTAVAALADPLCRAELDRYSTEDGDAAELLRHVAAAGPSELEDVKLGLGWSPPRMRRARAPLERSGALVSQSVTRPVQGGGHIHSSLLHRWDRVFPAPAPGGGFEELMVAGVRAAVVAPEAELGHWFSWPFDTAAVDRLVAERRLVRPEDGWVAAV